MARHEQAIIKLGLLASTIAALSLGGCVLDLDKLDAGQDDSADDPETGGNPSEALECLIGTEVDATGVEQSTFEPGCEVTCDDGWGHDADALPIAWTSEVEAYPPDSLSRPRAIGLFENGRVVVAIHRSGAMGFEHFEPDGVNFGGFDIEGIDSVVYGVEIDSHMAYVTHGDDDGTIHLSALSIFNDQQIAWTIDFTAHWATKPTRNGGRIAVSLVLDETKHELVVLDLDGNVQWQEPTVVSANANAVALSPSGARVAVIGESTRIHDAASGDLLLESSHGITFTMWPQSAAFVDEDLLVAIGSGIEFERFTGWFSGVSLSGDVNWEHLYNRATAWCPDPLEDDEHSAETAELLSAVTRLADGSLVAVGTENFEGNGVYGSHPWVAHFSADGEFLANDRGLWDGRAIDAVAGPDGSVFVLIAEGITTGCEGPCPDVSEGFAVRKYVP
ncbi:MAG TPA: hypothetical protein VM869_24695 [Enhygromyxa sp.]|nr:hypothetical protein [Enhygromyxa sp.]